MTILASLYGENSISDVSKSIKQVIALIISLNTVYAPFPQQLLAFDQSLNAPMISLTRESKSEQNDRVKFSFRYPDDLELSPKPVLTHQKEIYIKSTVIKGFSIGLTVN